MTQPSDKESSPTDPNDLLNAQTPEGVAYRENGLRNLEAALLAKQDWRSPEQREQALAQFNEMAARLRALDAEIIAKLN